MSGLVVWVLAVFGPFALIALIAYARGGRHRVDLAPPSPNAQWARDPSGRHELRLYDGTQWTAHVSDRGVSGWDPLS